MSPAAAKRNKADIYVCRLLNKMSCGKEPSTQRWAMAREKRCKWEAADLRLSVHKTDLPDVEAAHTVHGKKSSGGLSNWGVDRMK